MKKTPTIVAVTLMTASLALLGGCASGVGGKDYSRDQTRAGQEVQMGVVESVREVNIDGTKTPSGAGAGAVGGGVAGSTGGSGKGSVVGAAIGAVLGGKNKTTTKEATTRQKGVEITGKLD